MLAEAKVEPRDIDQVQTGQPVVLRFSAFNMRTTPEINGRVVRVAEVVEFARTLPNVAFAEENLYS